MSGFAEINRHPSSGERHKLALTFLIGFGLLGGLQWRAGNVAAAQVLAGLAGGLFVVTFVPPIGRLLYIAWMMLGICIGFVTQPIFMGVAFAVLFVPLGLVFRLAGRDLLRRKLTPGVATYWEDYPSQDDPARYFKQY